MATFENLRINQLSPAGREWFAKLLSVIETLDADAVVEFMVDDVEVSSDSGRSVQHSRDDVRAALVSNWESVDNLVHDELNLYGSDHNFVHEARVTIGFADGRESIVQSLVASRVPIAEILDWR